MYTACASVMSKHDKAETQYLFLVPAHFSFSSMIHILHSPSLPSLIYCCLSLLHFSLVRTVFLCTPASSAP